MSSGSPKLVPVVAAVIHQGDTFLLARRRSGKSLAGFWEFPGGKIEPGETPQVALARELREEFSIEALVGSHIATHTHSYDHVSIELSAYETRVRSGEFQLHDHDAIAWVMPHEATAYKLAPADVPILEAILQLNR